MRRVLPRQAKRIAHHCTNAGLVCLLYLQAAYMKTKKTRLECSLRCPLVHGRMEEINMELKMPHSKCGWKIRRIILLGKVDHRVQPFLKTVDIHMFPAPDLFHGGITNHKYIDVLVDFMLVVAGWTSFYLHCYTMNFF